MANGVAELARKMPSIEDRCEFEGDGIAAARAGLRATLYEVRERESGDEFCLKLWRKRERRRTRSCASFGAMRCAMCSV